MLLQLSQFFPSTQLPLTPLGNPHTVVHAHGSCVYDLWPRCSLCCTLQPHDYSVTINLYFLIPHPFHPAPRPTLISGNHQNILCIYDSDSVSVSTLTLNG